MTRLREFLTGLGALPATPGEASTARGIARPDVVKRCEQMIHDSGVLDMIATWEYEDSGPRQRKGGRPRNVSHRAILVGMLVLGVEAADLSAKELHTLLSKRLSAPDARRLGLPSNFAYYSTWRSLRALADLIDPVPGTRRDRPTWAMVQAFRERVTPQQQAARQQRANDLVNTLLATSARLGTDFLPDRLDLSVDATVYPIYGKRGHPGGKKRTEDSSMSPEFLAGWHAKTQDKRERADVNGKAGTAEYTFGYDLHLGVLAAGRGDRSMPRLFTSAVLNTPGMTPGRCAVQIGHYTRAFADSVGAVLGYFVVDRGYSDQLAVNFHRPLQADGWSPVFDYKDNDRSAQGAHAGMRYLTGSFYCPSTPEHLLTAHTDHQAGRIDDETYDLRRERLHAHRMRLKQKPTSDDSSLVFECPAAGPNATATCPFKQPTVNGKTLVQISRRPDDVVPPPKVCTNKRSVSVPVEHLPKGYQELEYRSEAFDAVYRPGRSQIEGENRILKDVNIRLADASQRRGRGFGLHCLIAAVKVAVANVREIARYLRDGLDQAPPPPRPKRGRPTNTTFADYALPADQPTYIVGQKAPPKVA